jgi:hypothetical protein
VPTIPTRYVPPKLPTPPPAVVGKRKRDETDDLELGDAKKHKGNEQGDEIEIDDDDIEVL